MMMSDTDTCKNCGKEVENPRYHPEVGCVCSEDCFRAVIIPIRLRQAGLDEGLYAEMQLDNFEFGDDRLKESLYYYLEHPDPKGWAFLGDVGVGKTHLAVGMAREIIERYMLNAKMISTPALMASLYDNMKVDGKIRSLMETYKETDLLVLDDLGAELPSEYAKAQIFLVMDHRLMHKKLTLITSNYSIRIIAERVGDRIASRIIEMCRPVSISGGDNRLNK